VKLVYLSVGQGPRRRILLALGFCIAWCITEASWAIGTDAGLNIENTATVNFEISGAAQTPVTSNTTQTLVDELIDAVVVSNDGGAVAVSTPETGAVLQFTVTNTGNGSEVYQLIADPNVAEGGFDPNLNQIYLETNGVPGLQIGSDLPYVTGIADPTLAEDESLIVYLQANIPAVLNQTDLGEIQLRAISATLTAQTAADDPNDPTWPVPGTAYAGLGDGGSDAVIGTTHQAANPLILNSGQFQVAAAVVAVSKTAVAVVDPFGGTTIVPGTVITYQLELSVNGSGSADNVVLTDVIPSELEYVANTLNVAEAAEEDDFAPAGTDNSGYEGGTATLRVTSPTIAGGSAALLVTFDATVR